MSEISQEAARDLLEAAQGVVSLRRGSAELDDALAALCFAVEKATGGQA